MEQSQECAIPRLGNDQGKDYAQDSCSLGKDANGYELQQDQPEAEESWSEAVELTQCLEQQGIGLLKLEMYLYCDSNFISKFYAEKLKVVGYQGDRIHLHTISSTSATAVLSVA